MVAGKAQAVTCVYGVEHPAMEMALSVTIIAVKEKSRVYTQTISRHGSNLSRSRPEKPGVICREGLKFQLCVLDMASSSLIHTTKAGITKSQSFIAMSMIEMPIPLAPPLTFKMEEMQNLARRSHYLQHRLGESSFCSNYSRGHLIKPEDRHYSVAATKTFYMSNMSPPNSRWIHLYLAKFRKTSSKQRPVLLIQKAYYSSGTIRWPDTKIYISDVSHNIAVPKY